MLTVARLRVHTSGAAETAANAATPSVSAKVCTMNPLATRSIIRLQVWLALHPFYGKTRNAAAVLYIPICLSENRSSLEFCRPGDDLPGLSGCSERKTVSIRSPTPVSTPANPKLGDAHLRGVPLARRLARTTDKRLRQVQQSLSSIAGHPDHPKWGRATIALQSIDAEIARRTAGLAPAVGARFPVERNSDE